MKIEIRRATEQHINTLLPFIARYHAFEGIEQLDTARRSAVETLVRHEQFGGIWLVYHDTLPIGYIALCKGFSIEFAGFDAFIDEFYIDEGYRGKGVGRQVLEHMPAVARQLGIRALHLEVARDNTTAKRLYSSLGFEGRDKYLLMSTIVDPLPTG